MKAKQCHEVTSGHINHCKKQDYRHVLILQTSLGTWCSCYSTEPQFCSCVNTNLTCDLLEVCDGEKTLTVVTPGN